MSVIVVIGAGSIGQAIARRVGTGKHVLMADLKIEFAEAAAKTLKDAGFPCPKLSIGVIPFLSQSELRGLDFTEQDLTELGVFCR